MIHILITGASQGIGSALVQLLSADARHRIVALSRNETALQNLAQTSRNATGNDNVHILPFDLGNDDYDYLRQTLLQIVPQLDIIVHNAGLLINKPFNALSDTDVWQLFQTNTFAAWKLVKYLHPHIAQGGHIVTIGSMGGFQGSAKFAGLSAYSASKAALSCWSECLAEELKPLQIAVNCLCLGAVQTEMLSSAFPDFKAPLSAPEMASFIADFALHGHRFFNGKTLPVSVNTP